jgi:autotransporter-associated beta strand protein
MGNSLKKTGAGTLVLTGTSTYTGGTQLLGGILSVSSDTSLGDAAGALTFDGGALQNTAALTSARNITLDAGGGTFLVDAPLSLTGTISGSGSLTKAGGETMTLTGADSYTGGTTVSAGTLQIGDRSPRTCPSLIWRSPTTPTMFTSTPRATK